MTNIKVTKEFPLPADRSKRQYYPFAEMEVGDSFELSYDKAANVRAAINYYKLKHDGDFQTKKVDGNVRVWRVS